MKRGYTLSIILLGFVVFFIGCGQKIYKTQSNFEKTIIHTQKTVAVLPFRVSSYEDQLGDENTMYQNKTMGYIAQTRVSVALLDQFAKKRYNIEFQDINKTNARLRDSHISYEELLTRDKSEICRLLGVDAVISGTVRSTITLADGVASALPGVDLRYGFPNRSEVSFTIHDQEDGQLLWQYDYKTATVVGNNIQALMAVTMRNVTARFPYKKK